MIHGDHMCKLGRARAKRQSSTPGIIPEAFEALLQQQPLRQTFCVQVYRQVKTDKCAKVTQQTQCLSFLEYKRKKKSNSWAYLGTETPPVFVSFFCVFPLHFFLLKVTWICTRYGVEKNAVQKRNADERKIRVETHCKLTTQRHPIQRLPRPPLHTHIHMRTFVLVKKNFNILEIAHHAQRVQGRTMILPMSGCVYWGKGILETLKKKENGGGNALPTQEDMQPCVAH